MLIFITAFELSAHITPLEAANNDFPKGTATPSEECGACHQKIYQEYTQGSGMPVQNMGFASDDVGKSTDIHVATGSPIPATAHARAGMEAKGSACANCHSPGSIRLPEPAVLELKTPEPRPAGEEAGGVTCASCHMTPEGNVRAVHVVKAPHTVVVDSELQKSVMCANCHSLGKHVPGMRGNTFFEWRDDFQAKQLGSQQCQDCHMPRTIRKTAEGYDAPERTVARHLWTGGHSLTQVADAISLIVVQAEKGKPQFELHVANLRAGHSLPTGSAKRALRLQVKALNASGKVVAEQEWLFAPSFSARPDDKAFLEADMDLPEATAKGTMQADSQGPHESPLMAGESRVLKWNPKLDKGNYTVKTTILFDTDRFDQSPAKKKAIIASANLFAQI
jgi:hypothetical protein